MKITGTKKLLIIFFALICALAVGLGVMISRSGTAIADSNSPATSYAEGEVDSSADGDEEDIKENVEEELVEKEYDENFDETAMREVAELFNVEYELVNFYCHANNVDPRIILEVLLNDLQNIEKAENSEVFIDYDKNRDGALTEEEAKALAEKSRSADVELEGSVILEDIMLFKDAYINGEVELSAEAEQEDWFVSPDDVSTYANTWYFLAYQDTSIGGKFSISIENMDPATASTQPWIDITSQIVNDANLHIPSTNNHTQTVHGAAAKNEFGTYVYRETGTGSGVYYSRNLYTGEDLTSGAHNYDLWQACQCGYKITLELEPGQRIQFYANAKASDGSGSLTMLFTYDTSNAWSHWESISWYANSSASLAVDSYVTTDGDAPNGSIFALRRGSSHNTANDKWWRRLNCWNIASSYTSAGSAANPSNAANYNKCTQFWFYVIEVKRKDPPKPVLVEHDAGSTTTRTKVFDGEPVTLTASNDYGSSLLTWSASTNQNFTQPDDSVVLKSRSRHGTEPTVENGFKPANIVLQSSAKGTHYVRFMSTTGRWSDGSTTPVTFKLVVTEQYTTRPTLKQESGVNAKGTEKIVNYTGYDLTVTFLNADPAYVNYSAPGMYEDSWDSTTKTLVLKQKEQGTYTITLYLINPGGCSWSNDHTTGSIQFTFRIKEMLINKPTITDYSPDATKTDNNAITADYNGQTKTLTISPARKEQLIVIAAGIEYNFVTKDTTGDGNDDYFACVFEMVNSGTTTITIMPEEGYLWFDGGGTSNTISFKITINALPVDFPVLKVGQPGYEDANTVITTFMPEQGWAANLIIEKIPEGAIVPSHAMQEVSWLTTSGEKSENSLQNTVLTLSASRAITYVVTFTLANNNYRWKENGNPPTFTLEIKKYELTKPYISDDSYDIENKVVKNPRDGSLKIDGDTKTIYWNNDPNIGQLWTYHDKKDLLNKDDSSRYFDLFVGGLLQGSYGSAYLEESQIEIRYSKAGLNTEWHTSGSSLSGDKAFLTLWATEAGNYLIDITPTDNYVWEGGSNDMITFKFEVVPVFYDTPTMFSQFTGGSSWSPEGLSARTDYDGTEQYIRIGDENNATRYYLPTAMSWALVENDNKNNVLWNTNGGEYKGFSLKPRNLGKDKSDKDITVLEGYAINAGTYTIRLQLGTYIGGTFYASENYAWRDGQGYDLYYTFVIEPQSLGTPKILESECAGGEDLKVYSTINMLTTGYNGGDVQLVINVKNFKVNGESIISVINGLSVNEDVLPKVKPSYDPSDPNADPTSVLWQADWDTNKDGIERLTVMAVNVGYYVISLKINNPNYKWDNDDLQYDFYINIDYANVQDILFYYGEGDDMSLIGGDNSDITKTYDPDLEHKITVIRSTEAFKDTVFEEQFYFDVSYNKPDHPMIGQGVYNGTDNLLLTFKDANTYYIEIYLTPNYRWESANGIVGQALHLTFTILPKLVNIPTIIDEGETEGNPIINASERIKSITYDSKTWQSIAIELGDDYRAYSIDTTQTTSLSTFNKDDTVSTLDKKIRYTAKSAGTYVIALKLSDDNNYLWYGDETVFFTLKILTRSINLPDVFFALQYDDVNAPNGVSDPHNDYLDIKSGKIGDPVAIDPIDGIYKASHDYTGKLQYIYLFGYAVENGEVTITVTYDDNTNADGWGQNNISVSGIMRGTYVYAKLVNTYKITLEFKLSDEFGTPNCHWALTGDVQERIYQLTIDKLGIALPEINADPTQAWVKDNNNNDSLSYHFTYNGAAVGPTLVIDNCLSMSPIKYMSYSYNASRTKYFLDETTKKFSFSITGVATVGVEYVLVISIDKKNEYWINPAVTDDDSDKYIYIIIDQLAVTAPNILDEHETNATYGPDYKMFTYNGSAWPSALKIENIPYDYLDYRTSTASMSALWVDTSNNNVLVTGSTVANAGTYSVIFSLKDKTNIRWDLPSGTSDNLVLSLIIDPERIAKPVFDSTNTDYNTSDTWSLTDNDTTLNVIYMKDSTNVSVMQYIVILNFVDNFEKMSFDIISSRNFGDSQKGTNTLRFGAEDVGTYKVKITPSNNVGWDDGTADPIVFTLNIAKKEYATPQIIELGTNTVSGQTRTVSYILDTYQQFIITGVDNNILEFVGSTSSLPDDKLNRELRNDGITGPNYSQYNFSALNVGTYTVTFNLINPDNERLAFADVDHITFTFVIEKMNLAVPVFDLEQGLLLNDESVTSETFTAVYDSQRHGVLVLNVLDDKYITFKPENSIYDKNSGTSKDFYYGDQVSATSSTDTVGTVFNSSGVNTKFDGSFANGTTTLADPLTRTNYILLHAAEPGTYVMVFSIVDHDNMQWASGTDKDEDKSVTFVMRKKQIAVPDYNTGVSTTKPYTGNPVTFELKNVYGVQADSYVDASGSPASRGFEYEIFEISSQPDNTMPIVASILNVDTHVLTLTAIKIGTYKVRIKIADTTYTQWTTSTQTMREFTFTISKSGITSEIAFTDPKLADGNPDTQAQADFSSNIFKWPKSTTVTVQVTLSNLNVGADGKLILDESLGLDIYYVNIYNTSVKLCDNDDITPSSDAADLFSNPAPTTAGSVPSTVDPRWSLVLSNTGIYSLVYTFTLTYDTDKHSDGFIPKGKYSLHVEQVGASTTYVVASTSKDFEVDADRAPFLTDNIEDHIVWQRYLVSDPDTIVKEYSLADIFPTATNPHWSDMTANDAVKLNFLEDNDSYGFRFALDSTIMLTETDVRTVLQSWKVDWTGVYTGKSTAKYAGSYSVSVTIKALDPNAYSFPDKTYTFYYNISQMVYDLDGLVWDYSGTPFTYDGTAHAVKLTGTLPAGLSVASYEVTGYDRNSQIYASHYTTSVKFTSSNPNYLVPDVTDISTYKSTIFQWTVDWDIDKAEIDANWSYELTADDTATMSIPRLDAHGEKVVYTYYKDNGNSDPWQWDIVTSFVNDQATDYMVVATLKSDPDDPALDYARNYNLTVHGGDSDKVNALTFTMPKGSFIGLYVEIDGKEQYGGDPNTSNTGNIHKYTVVSGNPKVFSATVTLVGAVGMLTDSNLAITYYNTANTLKPIDAPTDPGHYLIKVKLVGIDTSVDTTQYVLPVSEYYFDVEKGDFDKDSVYWRYTHTDSNGTVTIAKYDEAWKIWQIVSVTDIDGTEDLSQVGMTIPSFVYDGSVHTVELYSEIDDLSITTKNRAQLNAGKFTEANGKYAVASFSYIGKLWNSPTDPANPIISSTTFEWEIEKAVIDIAGLQWDYTDDYVYTISGGVEQKFTVKMDDSTIPDLLRTFVEYKTYDLDHLDSESQPSELMTSILTKAGHYRTEFIYDAFEEDTALKQNYEIGAWPSGLDKALDWEIAVREIEIPASNGTWTVFDGVDHDLISLVTMPENWQEYITVSIEYAKPGTTAFADNSEEREKEFGSAMFASHAGKYKYTFSIIKGINSADQTNVAFNVFNPSTMNVEHSTAEQELIIDIAKAMMVVEDWVGDDEWSTVTLSGTYVSNEFVDYYFTDSTNAKVSVDIVAATSGETFTMHVYVRAEFANDIDLVAATGKDLFHVITTLSISNDPDLQEAVKRVPYIIGYQEGSFRTEFTYEQWQEMMLADTEFWKTDTYFLTVWGGKMPESTEDLKVFWYNYLGSNPKDPYDPNVPEEGDEAATVAEVEDPEKVAIRVAEYKSKIRVSVTYSGQPITFIISDWSVYSQYLGIWQGNLTQNNAGDYSVTLMFKKDITIPPYCWAYRDENGNLTEVNRDTVTLNFRIAFNMIPVPEIGESMYPTYTGGEHDILKRAWKTDKAYDEWLEKYGEYFEAVGATGTLAGGYTLQLKIKDIYTNTVHWNNDTAKGQPGTYTIQWKILPIYITIPTTSGAEIVYDGSAHSVFELFEGYKDGELSKELQALMQLAKISGDSGVNAGSYEARFLLPDTNYAWKSSTGGISNDLLQTLPWAIQKKKLDMSKIHWNYDPSNPFQYTLENGEVQEHSIVLEGVPEELNEFITYITNGQIGNKASLMGTYNTVVYFFQDNIEYENYSMENAPKTFLDAYPDPAGVGYVAITWNIIERRFNAPQDTEVKFDGTIRELLELFGLPEGWENYIEASVEYKAQGSDSYVSYFDVVANDAFLGYSPFRAFYLGSYRVEFSIKSDLNKESTCVVWVNDGQTELVKQRAVVTIVPLEITIKDWNDDGNYHISIVSDQYAELTADPERKELLEKEVFEYVICDQATGEVVDKDIDKAIEKIKERGAGLMYTIEFRIRPGNDYAISKGIKIGCKDDTVTNPYVFGNYDFPGGQGGKDSVLLWLPIPKLVPYTGAQVYDGTVKTYQIDNWDDYLIDNTFAAMMMTTYSVNIREIADKVKSGGHYLVPVGKYASFVDVDTGEISIEGAGEFDIVLQFLPNVNICWYDSDKYAYEGGLIKDKTNGNATVSGDALTKLIDRSAKKLEISIEKKALDPLTPEILELLESMIPDLDYDGYVYDLRDKDRVKAAQALFKYLDDRYPNLLKYGGDLTGISAGTYSLRIQLRDSNSSYWNLKQNETVELNEPGYQIMWVTDGTSWSVKYVKEDSDGTLTGADGMKYSEYGEKYSLDVVYKMNYVFDYVQIMEYVQVGDLLDSDGKPKEDGNKYLVDADGRAKRYARKKDDNNIEINEYVEDSKGGYIARYKSSVADLFDEEGKPIETTQNKYLIDDEGYAIRYAIKGNTYVEDPDGAYIAKYKVKADGTLVATPEQANGRNVIDTVKSKATITRTKTSTDDYIVKWRIVGSTLAAPTLNGKKLSYNGKEQSAEAALTGYTSMFMEIVEGASGVNAGEYTAKIKIIDENYSWRDGTEVIVEDGIEYVKITWSIAKATVDFKDVTWKFTDGVNVYENGEGMVYTRKSGSPVIYWVELDNLPEAVQGAIRYKTNNVVGAHAGTDAGLYITSFEIVDPYDNFEDIIMPETLPDTIKWNIQRRKLEIPSLSDSTLIFDDQVHDLWELLNLQEDWDQYFTITVMYAKNFVLFSTYEGYNGNRFAAYGAGAYRFMFNIIPGINKNDTNPSVVWLKNSYVAPPEVTEPDEDEGLGGEEAETPDNQAETESIAQFALAEQATEAVAVAPAVVKAESVEEPAVEVATAEGKPDIAKSVVQQVCDRIKNLVYGAQIHLQSHRKYLG